MRIVVGGGADEDQEFESLKLKDSRRGGADEDQEFEGLKLEDSRRGEKQMMSHF